MSFPAPAALAVADPLSRWRRPYAGPLVALALAGRPAVRFTPGHPVLTHAGWRRARIIVPGVHVVAADTPTLDAEATWAADAAAYGTHPMLDQSFDHRVLCYDPGEGVAPRPAADDEAVDPTVDPTVITHVLDALCTTAEFGVATWAQACDRVPGLAEIYPHGPVLRHDGISDDARRRLGTALAALPAPPLDRAGLGARLLGLSAPLHLVEVTEVGVGPVTAVVHDVTARHGAMVVDGVVVGA